jgi:hypothetical protein
MRSTPSEIRSSALHEAGHAVGVVRFETHSKIIDVRVGRAAAIPGKAGRVRVKRDYTDPAATISRAIITALLGRLMDPDLGDVPDYWAALWNGGGEHFDRYILEGRITEQVYDQLVFTAKEIAADPDFRGDVEALAAALVEHPCRWMTGAAVTRFLDNRRKESDAGLPPLFV